MTALPALVVVTEVVGTIYLGPHVHRDYCEVAIADIIEPHVAQVVLADPKAVCAAVRGGPKTDRIDAALLARLLPSGVNFASRWTVGAPPLGTGRVRNPDPTTDALLRPTTFVGTTTMRRAGGRGAQDLARRPRRVGPAAGR